jgi:hypothetical protein
VHRAVLRDRSGRARACLQLAERGLLGPLGAGFLLRGPVWLDRAAREDHEPTAIAAIQARLGRRILVWAPEAAPLHVRRPVMTGYSTSWLDLASDAETLRGGLATDWRNRLRQAESNRIVAREARQPEAIAWLLDRNEAYRREVGYRGPTRAFLGRLAVAAQAAGELLPLLAFERAEPVAGIMLVRHGCSATYEVGYVSPRGRELRATHLLLWRAIEALRRDRVRWLDLGGIATDRSPGIARFKLGLGGAVATLPGTFLARGKVRWRGRR